DAALIPDANPAGPPLRIEEVRVGEVEPADVDDADENVAASLMLPRTADSPRRRGRLASAPFTEGGERHPQRFAELDVRDVPASGELGELAQRDRRRDEVALPRGLSRDGVVLPVRPAVLVQSDEDVGEDALRDPLQSLGRTGVRQI